jgi:hypothetical protein
MQIQMRTLTGYALAVLVVLAILNGTAWFVGAPPRPGPGVFSAGFALGMLGMYIAAHSSSPRRRSPKSNLAASGMEAVRTQWSLKKPYSRASGNREAARSPRTPEELIFVQY